MPHTNLGRQKNCQSNLLTVKATVRPERHKKIDTTELNWKANSKAFAQQPRQAREPNTVLRVLGTSRVTAQCLFVYGVCME